MTEERITALRAEYRAARESERVVAAARRRLQRLRVIELETEPAVTTLRAAARAEEAEAARWAGKGFAQMFSHLAGQLGARRLQEAHEALVATARYAVAQQELDDVRAEMAALRAIIDTPVDAEAALQRLRAALWQDEDQHERALSLDHVALEAASNLREHDEALAAIDRALSAAMHAETHFRDAHWLGLWDMWGGGSIASAMKQNEVRDALEDIESAARALQSVRRELADVHFVVDLPAGLEVDSLAWKVDVWWDNWISDGNMAMRITEARERTQAAASTLEQVRDRVAAARATAAEVATKAAAEADAAMLGQ